MALAAAQTTTGTGLSGPLRALIDKTPAQGVARPLPSSGPTAIWRCAVAVAASAWPSTRPPNLLRHQRRVHVPERPHRVRDQRHHLASLP